MRKYISIFLSFLLTLSLLSCSPAKKNQDEGYTFTDDLGREVTILENDKIAACHASFAD